MSLDSKSVDELLTQLIGTSTSVWEIKSRLRELFPDPHVTISVIESILNGQDIDAIYIAIYDRYSVIHRDLHCSSGKWQSTNARRCVTFQVG